MVVLELDEPGVGVGRLLILSERDPFTGVVVMSDEAEAAEVVEMVLVGRLPSLGRLDLATGV